MAKILVNDGIHAVGQQMLENAGFEVVTEKVAQADLAKALPEYDAICVRSATKVRTALIDQCPNLKVIGRGGVGLDNIDVDYARGKGIKVINTPAASSDSVAELVFAHAFTLARFLHQANRDMPSKGDSEFKQLKKSYSKGIELSGRTLGIIGFGRIGQSAARLGLGLGMKVLPVDPVTQGADVELSINGEPMHVHLKTVAMDEMLAQADVITLHVPSLGRPLLGAAEFDKMKDGVLVVNAARGGVIDEDALLAALESGKVAAAGLDVFENEPTPRQDLLSHPRVSLTPHIGASTGEAQANIGRELAQQLIDLLKE
ncbi:MAG: D-2-hydroxyacid dehydrogenase [Bacteroidota bacterium]